MSALRSSWASIPEIRDVVSDEASVSSGSSSSFHALNRIRGCRLRQEGNLEYLGNTSDPGKEQPAVECFSTPFHGLYFIEYRRPHSKGSIEDCVNEKQA